MSTLFSKPKIPKAPPPPSVTAMDKGMAGVDKSRDNLFKRMFQMFGRQNTNLTTGAYAEQSRKTLGV